MTNQQWNEFLDKLDFVQLTQRWSMLPLHWLDDDFPEQVSDSAKELVRGLMELRSTADESERLAGVQQLCQAYRARLSNSPLLLDSKLSPPGSRVTLRFLDPHRLGEGDCLITVGSWDRVGYLIAELANPGGKHLDSVGETAVRQEPGELSFRHLLLFPDKGAASPRSFRNLCEKTLRQARGLGARHLSVTHLHLPQTGLADRFAAAELVSAVRQLLREGPGTTVEILAYTHRNFEDYKHWFESLKGLVRENQQASSAEYAAEPSPEAQEFSEVSETLKNLAKRSSDLANEATASVSRWFSEKRPDDTPSVIWTGFNYAQNRALNLLYLGHWERFDASYHSTDESPIDVYLKCLRDTVCWESAEQKPESDPRQSIREKLFDEISELGEDYPLTRYFQLLNWRLIDSEESKKRIVFDILCESAREWDDRPLASYLRQVQEDSAGEQTMSRLIPVGPAGSKSSKK